MAWVHDTGYQPAYDHTGYPVSVLVDGTETASSSDRTASEVIGWRSACECGWRGMQFYPRSEWPSSTGSAPDGVDGWETGTAAYAEWDRHLDRVLPELAVHDLARQLVDVEERLHAAVQAARLAGLSWSRIAAVAGTSPNRAAHRWGPTGQHSRAAAPDLSAGSCPFQNPRGWF